MNRFPGCTDDRIADAIWEEELLSYKEFPPMQAPETYNLDGILKAMQQSGHNGHD